MQIRELVDLEKNLDLGTTNTKRDQSTCHSDSCFFTSLLEEHTKINASNTRPSLAPGIADAINPLYTSKMRMAKLLKSTNKQLDMTKFREFPGVLANIQITSQLLVKCLAKTTQSIDKVSNLQ